MLIEQRWVSWFYHLCFSWSAWEKEATTVQKRKGGNTSCTDLVPFLIDPVALFRERKMLWIQMCGHRSECICVRCRPICVGPTFIMWGQVQRTAPDTSARNAFEKCARSQMCTCALVQGWGFFPAWNAWYSFQINLISSFLFIIIRWLKLCIELSFGKSYGYFEL